MSAEKPSIAELQGPVLITGGAGYIGSHTTRAFRELGVETVVLDNLSTGHSRFIQGEFERADLGDRTALENVFAARRPVAVVHFAAKTHVGESVSEPATYYRENVQNTWNLLEAMRAHDCRDIVFSSSCATYGLPLRTPIDEGHPQTPISPYGRTKLHMEHMLEDFSRAYGLRCAALRYFNAAGASPAGDLGEIHVPETHLIPLVLFTALGLREKVSVFGHDYDTPDGTCIRDYVHVDDLARAHVRALAKLQQGTERLACNLGTGTGFSVLEVIETCRNVTGRKVAVELAPRRAGDPPRLVSGGSLARELLGWEPQRAALADIVGDAWKFHVAEARASQGRR